MVMSLALLHTGARVSPASFTVHSSTVVGIVGLAGLYEYGAKVAKDRGPRPVQRWMYHGALVVMFLSLNGWLHDLAASYLFRAHMIPHLMLAFVVAPLMIMGTTGEMLRPLIRNRTVRRIAEWGLAPTRCFAIFNVVIAAWHLPPLYNYALAHPPLHIAQHLNNLASSVIK